MTPKLAEYIEAGKSLGTAERLEAARQLLLSVDYDDAEQGELDEAWDEAIDRRVSEVVSGTARTVDGRAAHAQIRAELAARRK
jgi:hypothetical protein